MYGAGTVSSFHTIQYTTSHTDKRLSPSVSMIQCIPVEVGAMFAFGIKIFPNFGMPYFTYSQFYHCSNIHYYFYSPTEILIVIAIQIYLEQG